MNKSIYDNSWEATYNQGKMLNKYPFDLLVSLVFRQFGNIQDKSKIKVLDIGCGAGNNSWFFAKEGFNITGIDISEEAIKFAQSRFKNEKLSGKFIQKNFSDIGSLQSKFDLIIDREALYTQDYKELAAIFSEINNSLSPNGIFVSFFYNKEHPLKKFYPKTENEITYFAVDNEAPLGKRASFLDENTIKIIFKEFKYELYNHQIIPLKVDDDILSGLSEYIIICKKK